VYYDKADVGGCGCVGMRMHLPHRDHGMAEPRIDVRKYRQGCIGAYLLFGMLLKTWRAESNGVSISSACIERLVRRVGSECTNVLRPVKKVTCGRG
jgi:hypothetical protein